MGAAVCVGSGVGWEQQYLYIGSIRVHSKCEVAVYVWLQYMCGCSICVVAVYLRLGTPFNCTWSGSRVQCVLGLGLGALSY